MKCCYNNESDQHCKRGGGRLDDCWRPHFLDNDDYRHDRGDGDDDDRFPIMMIMTLKEGEGGLMIVGGHNNFDNDDN